MGTDQSTPPQTTQRLWRQGRRASDPFLTDVAPLAGPLFEQIPLQLINEAEEDGSHLWSSMRQTNEPPQSRPRQRPQPG